MFDWDAILFWATLIGIVALVLSFEMILSKPCGLFWEWITLKRELDPSERRLALVGGVLVAAMIGFSVFLVC